jgi:hypothetical protein
MELQPEEHVEELHDICMVILPELYQSRSEIQRRCREYKFRCPVYVFGLNAYRP